MSTSNDTPRAILAATGMAVLLTCIACDGARVDESPSPTTTPAPAPIPAAEPAPVESWQCRNDLEVSCSDGACEAAAEGEFTAMSVDFNNSGTMSVCAYSGCWEGTGEVLESGNFLVLTGHDLAFSTARDSDSASADVVVALDRTDKVATLKAEAFAHPLLCKRIESADGAL